MFKLAKEALVKWTFKGSWGKTTILQEVEIPVLSLLKGCDTCNVSDLFMET